MSRAKFDGSTKDGIREGKGKPTWPGQTFYEGDFHAGLRHGFGLYQLAAPVRATKENPGNPGRSYEGEWRNGMRHGRGREVWPNGDTLVGSFRHGKASGPGTLVTRSGRYEGQFVEGMRSGRGSFEWHSGATYEGEWKENRMWGRGKFVSADNRIYDGAWVKGVKEGTGAEITNDDRYDGEWVAGKKHGEGTLRWPNGRWRGGEWKNGERLRWTTTERIGGRRKSS